MQYVTGFCAKDCGQPKGDVMIQFGAGKVDFKGVFQVLKSAASSGRHHGRRRWPRQTPDVIRDQARANREFLEKVLTQLA